MTWLWKVPDLRTRIEFARRTAPQDVFTQIARLIVYYAAVSLIFVLTPVDYVGRSIGKAILSIGRVIGIFFVFGLLFFMLLSALWIPFWGLLVGSSWLWLNQAWTRPILLLPGVVLSIILTAVIMLVPDPEKNPKYVTLTREWPLAWTLYYPPPVYFEEHNIWDPDVNPYEADRLFRSYQKREEEPVARKYDPDRNK